jgi:hypothetical protein
MQDPYLADLTANETGVFCQMLCGSRRNPKEQIIQQMLVAAHDFI